MEEERGRGRTRLVILKAEVVKLRMYLYGGV